MRKKSWWKRTSAKKEEKEHLDILNDIEAITDYLKELGEDAKVLLSEFEKLVELEKEREVASSGIIQINLDTQANVLNKLLERYEFLQNDVSINGLRLKAIAQQFLENAKKEGMKDLVKEKKQDRRWKFFW